MYERTFFTMVVTCLAGRALCHTNGFLTVIFTCFGADFLLTGLRLPHISRIGIFGLPTPVA